MGWDSPLGDESARSRIGWWLFAGVLATILLVTLADYLGWAVFGVFLGPFVVVLVVQFFRYRAPELVCRNA